MHKRGVHHHRGHGDHGATRVAEPGSLTSPAWSASSTATGASGVSYTYTFTTATGGLLLTTVKMGVPPGTGGTPAVGAARRGTARREAARRGTAHGAGWHFTVTATTLTSGSNTLANSGTLVFTGSATSVSAATAPTATCVGSCTLPTDAVTYPVAITTAASAPTAFTLYGATAGTGLGAVTIGGSAAAHPAGWWVNIPAQAYAGSYTTTVTLTVASGP